jgi:hypothetical protein
MDTDEYESVEQPDPDDPADSGPVEEAERIYQRARDTVAAKSTRETDAVPPGTSLATRWERLWRRRHQFLFAAAFLTPFVVLALAGWLAVQFETEEDDAGETAAAPAASPLPPDSNFARHTVPAMIRNEIFSLNILQGYEFEGHAGDSWHIVIEALDTLDPQVRFYDPTGTELAYNDDQFEGSLSAELWVTLPVDGLYRLVVESAPKSGGSTGTYLLTLFPQ